MLIVCFSWVVIVVTVNTHIAPSNKQRVCSTCPRTYTKTSFQILFPSDIPLSKSMEFSSDKSRWVLNRLNTKKLTKDESYIHKNTQMFPNKSLQTCINWIKYAKTVLKILFVFLFITSFQIWKLLFWKYYLYLCLSKI